MKIMKSLRIFSITLLFFLVLLQAVKAELTGYVVQSGPSEVSYLYYTPGQTPGTDAYYQDAMGNNPDVGLMLCDDTIPPSYYVGLVYLMNQDSSPTWVLVSYGKSTSYLPQASVSDTYGGKQCKRTDIGDFTVSPSYYLTRTPTVYVSAFPARTYIMYSTSPTGTSPQFVSANNQLSGSYSCSLTYTYSTNTISFTLNSITAQTGSGSLSIALDDTYRGISSERPIIVGVCNNGEGTYCPTGVDILTSNSFPVVYTFDVPKSSVTDQVTYTRYGVVNGLECGSICIGADLTVSASVALDPIYYSQNQTISYTITNMGNVPVTNQFQVKIEIINSTGHVIHSTIKVYDDDLSENGGSTSDTYVWPAYAKSGTYTARVTVDSGSNIAECNEGNNQDSDTFELRPIVIPTIYINGTQTTVFPFAGIPYNVSIHLEDSDGYNVSNSTVILKEYNGISLFCPTQIWNYTLNTTNATATNGTLVITQVVFHADYWGNAELTLIPTGNILYAPEYSYVHMNSVLGSYGIELSGYFYDGNPFVFVINGQVRYSYPLTVNDYYEYERDGSKAYFKNYENYVHIIMNTVYTVFAKFWKMMVG